MLVGRAAARLASRSVVAPVPAVRQPWRGYHAQNASVSTMMNTWSFLQTPGGQSEFRRLKQAGAIHCPYDFPAAYLTADFFRAWCLFHNLLHDPLLKSFEPTEFIQGVKMGLPTLHDVALNFELLEGESFLDQDLDGIMKAMGPHDMELVKRALGAKTFEEFQAELEKTKISKDEGLDPEEEAALKRVLEAESTEEMDELIAEAAELANAGSTEAAETAETAQTAEEKDPTPNRTQLAKMVSTGIFEQFRQSAMKNVEMGVERIERAGPFDLHSAYIDRIGTKSIRLSELAEAGQLELLTEEETEEGFADDATMDIVSVRVAYEYDETHIVTTSDDAPPTEHTFSKKSQIVFTSRLPDLSWKVTWIGQDDR